MVRSHIDWGGEQNTVYKCVETSPHQTYFKKLEGKSKVRIVRSGSHIG